MPIDVAKAWQSPVESRGSSEVSVSSRRIIRISDSPRNVCTMCRSLSRWIVSRARLRSMPSEFDRYPLTLHFGTKSRRYPKTALAVLRPCLNPDCEGDRYSSTFGAVLDRTTRDSVFLNVVSRTIGLSLISGPFGLPGFCIKLLKPIFSLIITNTFLLTSSPSRHPGSRGYGGWDTWSTVCVRPVVVVVRDDSPSSPAYV